MPLTNPSTNAGVTFGLAANIVATTPAAGKLVYSTDTNNLYLYTGTEWRRTPSPFTFVASPILPNEVSGLLFWFKTPISGATNNTAITTWDDSSTSNLDATPAGTSLIYKTSVVNGLDVVQNNGDRATFTSTSLGTSHSVFAVVRPLSGFSDGVIVGGNALGKYTPYVDSTTIYYRPVITDSLVSVSHGGLTTNTTYLLEVIRSGTSVSFYKNGSQLSTTQTLAANTSLSVGAIGGLSITGADTTNLQIAEIFAFDNAISTSDRQGLEAYINDRFGIF